MVPAPNASPKAQALVRGFNRAVAEKLVIFRVDRATMGVATVVNGTWTLKPYSIAITGPRAQDVTCDCTAAKRGLECKHRSLAVYCRRHSVYALRPAVKEGVATVATFAPAVLISGIAPSLQDLY